MNNDHTMTEEEAQAVDSCIEAMDNQSDWSEQDEIDWIETQADLDLWVRMEGR